MLFRSYRFIEETAVVQDSELTSYLINKKGEILETNTKVDPTSRSNPEYQPFWDEEKKAAGFKNRNGKIILEPKYEAVGVFQEGRSIVKEKDRWGIIGKTGKFILPPKYDEMFHFYEGLASVRKNGKYGFINPNGKLVIAAKFDLVGVFSYGLAAVVIDGKIGYINKKVNLVIKPIFDETQGGRWSDFELINP